MQRSHRNGWMEDWRMLVSLNIGCCTQFKFSNNSHSCFVQTYIWLGLFFHYGQRQQHFIAWHKLNDADSSVKLAEPKDPNCLSLYLILVNILKMTQIIWQVLPCKCPAWGILFVWAVISVTCCKNVSCIFTWTDTEEQMMLLFHTCNRNQQNMR